jgi:hypothetical protein
MMPARQFVDVDAVIHLAVVGRHRIPVGLPDIQL